MTIFKDALAKGLQAHAQATAARREINEVLAVASKDVSSYLNAKVELQVEVVDRPTRELTIYEQAAGVPVPREKVTMLVARDERGRRELLADVQFAEIGFPVSLRWGREYRPAKSRDEFEQALSALFASAATGEKLSKLVTQAA